jgi:outer membrane murein-binding lipoprotein Lpp
LQDNASKKPCLWLQPVIAAINLRQKEPPCIGAKGWSTADQLERLKLILSIAMGRPLHLRWLVVTALLLAGCSTSALNNGGNDASQATFERLELRVNQLEQQLNDFKGASAPADSKIPAGPIRSLTLRLGTDDDRLRLYWGDGQTSDLACSQEGKGTWACG